MPTPAEFGRLYARFHAPITAFDCGAKCSPYNERGVPFCCDVNHALPTAYQPEWEYLQASTDLWRPWDGSGRRAQQLKAEVPDHQHAIVCLGHTRCQRNYRAIVCRSFPFYPYVTLEGEFIGLTYYWEYEDRCWIVSHLDSVTSEYRLEFIAAYDTLFEWYPDEREAFRQHAQRVRRLFSRGKRAIPLLHRNGGTYKITPRNGRMRRVDPASLPKFGPYLIASALPFPDET
jgi:hypothetical protein